MRRVMLRGGASSESWLRWQQGGVEPPQSKEADSSEHATRGVARAQQAAPLRRQKQVPRERRVGMTAKENAKQPHHLQERRRMGHPTSQKAACRYERLRAGEARDRKSV